MIIKYMSLEAERLRGRLMLTFALAQLQMSRKGQRSDSAVMHNISGCTSLLFTAGALRKQVHGNHTPER